MRSAPLSKRQWALKQMSGHFAHGKNMVRWKQQTSAQCLRCGHNQEDKHHILHCEQADATMRWSEVLK